MPLPKNFSVREAQERLLQSFDQPAIEDPIAKRASVEILDKLRRENGEKISRQVFERFVEQTSETELYRILRQHEIVFRNDVLRRTMGKYRMIQGDRIMLTRGVQSDPAILEILAAVQSFEDFTPENDPHGEHDFGCVTVQGSRFFFKIDYYHRSLEFGVDPYEEEPTRVLTIMRAEEY